MAVEDNPRAIAEAMKSKQYKEFLTEVLQNQETFD